MGDNLCKNCVRWYTTGVDQCDIPNCGMTLLAKAITAKDNKFDRAIYGDNIEKEISKKNLEKAKFYLERCGITSSILAGNSKVYGHPSKLNYDNTCKFYKPAPFKFLTEFMRNFY